MSMEKRALASVSSGQPSQPKRQCFGPVNQAMDAPENIFTPLEDFQRVVREEMQSAFGRTIQSCIVNAMHSVLEETINVNWLRPLLEETVKKQVTEALEHADFHSAYCGRECRAYVKSGEMNNVRKLQLRFRTKLSLPLYTGRKLKGENSDAIYVDLIDANTGDVVSSGPESNIKLDVCVLEGDFNKDDNDDWTREEFESYVVKKREGKRRLLMGNRQVLLKEGVGALGELIFTDNSSWNRSKSFRIGLKVTSGYCENAQIREAITEGFPVKEHRGESYRKKHPPASDDEVWRLEKIAKDGKSHQRLNDAGISKVEDFLLQLFRDSEKLKMILGMTETNWNILVDHAKTCTPSGKLYVYYQDDTRNHGVVLKNTGKLGGLIEDGAYFASDRLSTTQKEYADLMLKKARDNWNRVEEFHSEASFASILDKHSSSSPSGVTRGQSENLNPVEHNFPPRPFANAVGREASLPLVQSTSEGHKSITAVALPIQSQNIGPLGSPSQTQNISLQTPIQLPGTPPYWSPSSFNTIGVSPPFEGDLWISISDDGFQKNSASSFTGSMHNAYNYTEESFICNPPYDDNSGKTSGKGIGGWLKVKEALQWGYFIRKRTLKNCRVGGRTELTFRLN